tara:strand:+ start:284 stop:481 length:198 start_codon:yes stop_codon:yes gene_type:complete
MLNKKKVVAELMMALGCDSKYATEQLNEFMYQISPPRKDDFNLIGMEVNHPDGWYRKFDKPNKRK